MGMMVGPMPKGPRPIKKDTLRRIARTFSPYKPQVVLTTLAVLASAGLGLLPPFFLQTIVNKGLLGRDLATVAAYSMFTLAATFGSTGLSLGYAYLSTVIGQRI